MWVRMTTSHGPGHQSESVKYRYFHRATKIEIEEMVAEEHMREDYDYPITRVMKVAALPKSILKEKIQHYTFTRDNAIAMLEILAKTKTTIEYEHRCAKCGSRWTRFVKKCPNGVCGGKIKRVVKED